MVFRHPVDQLEISVRWNSSSENKYVPRKKCWSPPTIWCILQFIFFHDLLAPMPHTAEQTTILLSQHGHQGGCGQKLGIKLHDHLGWMQKCFEELCDHMILIRTFFKALLYTFASIIWSFNGCNELVLTQ